MYKVLYPETLVSAYADEEAASYPASNLLDDHPQKVWEATSGDSKIYLRSSGRANVVAVTNTNANTLYITLYDDTNGTELLTNGSFETLGGGGADVWDTWSETASDGAIANETTNVYIGSNAAKLTAGSSTNTLITQTINVSAETRYKLDFYTRGDGTHSGRYKIEEYDGSWSDLVALTDPEITGTDYTRVTRGVETSASVTQLRITLQCPDTDTGIAYFDGVSVLEAFESTLYDLSGIDTYWELITGVADERWDKLWHDYTYMTGEHTIEIDIQSAYGGNAYIGVARTGLGTEFVAPMYGLNQSFIDYSIVERLYNGATYVKDRNVADTFNGGIELKRERNFYQFMKNIAKTIKSNPVFFKIADIGDYDWITYARFSSPPVGDHAYYSHSIINFNIEEVV